MRTSIPKFSVKTPATLAVALTLALGLGACKKDDDAAPQAQVEAPAPAPAPPAAVDLKDVIEQDARYVVGISYPPAAKKYPGLAEALQRYANGARAELLKSVQAADPAKQTGPYELSLNFTLQAETPEIVAVVVGGTRCTCDAHGSPL